MLILALGLLCTETSAFVQSKSHNFKTIRKMSETAGMEDAAAAVEDVAVEGEEATITVVVEVRQLSSLLHSLVFN